MGSTTQADRIMKILTPLEEDFLLANKLSATEELSTLFEFNVELLHDEGDAGDEPVIVEPEDVLGQVFKLNVTEPDGTTRFFNGIVNRFSQGNRVDTFTYYYATIVPAVWVLTQRFQSRIFQQMNVIDILKKVFLDDNFNISWEASPENYKPRNYCVQYRETDFAFASRLMEEEGIYYYFEHTEDGHQMIIADDPQSHRKCPSKDEIPFLTEMPDDEGFVSSINGWRLDYKLQSGLVTLWDYNFQLGNKKLDAEQPTLVPVGGNDNMEIYEFPAGYARKYDGINKGGTEQKSDLNNVFEDNKRTAKTRMHEIDSQYKTFNGVSNCCSLTAGYRFKLNNHPTKDYNVFHTLVSVTHEVEQSPDYFSGEGVENHYHNTFKCMIHGSSPSYRPPQKTPKPIIQGSQTAFVVGPSGEEIFTDPYGRVKVQFHWDRDGQLDENSSCWVRVGQAWAGNKWGMMFIPRVGMEVIVDFLEGDPDQPIIRGCVYNPEAMPAYDLPDEKTKSGIKTDSSKGGKGFNELRFEDLKDHEQIFVHGEKDIDIRNKNDRREYVGNDHHFTVHHDRREKIERNESRQIIKDQMEEVGGDHHLQVKGNENIKIGGTHSLSVGGDISEKCTNHSEQAGQAIYLKAGMNIVIEAGVQISLKAGGSFIDIGPAGVAIKGTMVLINSGGAAGSGTAIEPVAPTAPDKPDEADDAKPGTKIELEKRSAARKQKEHKEDKTKKSWIKIALVDEAGKPVPGRRYRIKLANGRYKTGTLNKNGKAEVKGIDPGSCQVTFPDLDQEAWEDA